VTTYHSTVEPPTINPNPKGTAMIDPTTPADELKAMSALVRTLEQLDSATRIRVLGWLCDRYPIDDDES